VLSLDSGARDGRCPRATGRASWPAGAIQLLDRAYVPVTWRAPARYAATDDPAVNREVHDEAGRVGVWLNVADQPALCTFLVPAVVRRGELTIAVSTNGASPSMARASGKTSSAPSVPSMRGSRALRRLRERLQAEPDGWRRRAGAAGPGRPCPRWRLSAGDQRSWTARLRELGPA
jgi:precorrin-2 dehydrogenase/sirohydrochlorin ferrochelatase